MAKTRFTEIRLGAITRKLEPEMWCILNQMSSNIKRFEDGERPAKETLSRHRTLAELFLRHNKNYCRAVQAANRIDRCEDQTERHYRTTNWGSAIAKFNSLCEFFEKE